MKVFYLFWLALFLSPTSNMSAQLVTKPTNPDSVRIVFLLDSIRTAVYTKPDLANRLGRELTALMEQQEDTLLLARSNGMLGALFSIHSNDSVKRLSIAYMKKSIFFFQALGNSLGIQKNCLNLSAVYGRLNDNSKMLSYALKALELAKDLNHKQEHPAALGFALHNLGYCYKQLDWLDSALVNFHKARNHLQEADNPNLYKAMLNIGLIYIEQKQYEAAYQILHNAYETCREKGLGKISADLAGGLGYLMYRTSEYRKALEYRVIIDNSDFPSNLNLLNIVDCFIKLNELDSAAHYFRKVEESKVQFGNKSFYYSLKADLLESRGAFDEAIQYRHQSELLEDSLDAAHDIPEMAGLFLAEYARKQEAERSFYDKLLTKKNDQLALVILLAFIVVLFSIWLYRKYYSKSAAMYAERVENQYLNRKLVSQTANLAALHESLMQILKAVKDIEEHPLSDDITAQLKRTKKLILGAHELSTLWHNFFKHFEEVHPNLIETWQSSYELSKTEIKICAFLKMNLSYKEIAQILNIKPDSVRISVHRIKKKLPHKNGVAALDFL